MADRITRSALEVMDKMRGFMATPTWQSSGPLFPSGSKSISVATAKQPVVHMLDSFTDATLIFEMIARGYAVAKIPAQDLAEGLAE